MFKNKLFQNLGTKNEFHTKFRDENSSLPKNIIATSIMPIFYD